MDTLGGFKVNSVITLISPMGTLRRVGSLSLCGMDTCGGVDTGGTCAGGGVWLGWGTDCGDCGRKGSTQRKQACVLAGSDVRGKCKRITVAY